MKTIFTVGQMIEALEHFDKNQKLIIAIHLGEDGIAESQPFYDFTISENGQAVKMESEVI